MSALLRYLELPRGKQLRVAVPGITAAILAGKALAGHSPMRKGFPRVNRSAEALGHCQEGLRHGPELASLVRDSAAEWFRVSGLSLRIHFTMEPFALLHQSLVLSFKLQQNRGLQRVESPG